MPTKKVREEESLFHAAWQIKDPKARALFIDHACETDFQLAQRVRALLEMHELEVDISDLPTAQTTDDQNISERAGSQVGRYRLMEQIGEGGFGLVFVAEQQTPVKRKVALKVIKPGMDSRQVIARFEAERQALAMMDHPNIARVLDAGSTDSGRPYFVMELVRGIPITDYCDKNHLPTRERLTLFIAVCQAIQHAHQKGIIHRDIKPSNVLVTSHDGTPVAKVIDFGVAKAIHQNLSERTVYTNFAQMIGTPLYMSPEQAEMSGLDIDTRSDIYSLGVLLYELLTGTTPLEKRRIVQVAFDEIRRLIREDEPPKPSTRLSSSESIVSIASQRHTEPAKLSKLVRGDLDWITMKALEKDRTRRYEAANGLARDIQRYLDDEPVEACPPSTTYRLRKFARKNRLVLTGVTAITLLLIGGVAVSSWQAFRASRAESAAKVAEANAISAERAAIARAEGERLAKIEAQKKTNEALRATAAEKVANENAQKRLAQIERGNEIITSIFADFDIRKVKEGAEPLEALLAERLVTAAGQLEGEAIGDTVVVATMQDRLGQSLLNLGQPNAAIPPLERAVETRRAQLGENHPETLRSMNHLAWGYQDSGQLDRAWPLLLKTLDLTKEALGADHPETFLRMYSLSECYREAGKMDLALPLAEESVRLQTAKLGADNPDTLSSMNNLALCYLGLRKTEMAIPLLEETLNRRKTTLGLEHPDTLVSMNNLAEGYRFVRKLDLALPLYIETLDRMKTKLGEKHPDTLVAMNNLANCYLVAGNVEFAVPLYEESLKLSRQRLGSDHPHSMATMGNLSNAYRKAERFDLLILLLEEILSIHKAKNGEDDSRTIADMNVLACAYRDAGQLDRALTTFLSAAEKVEKRQFEDPVARSIIQNLVDCHERLSQFDQAEDVGQKWLSFIQNRDGDDSVLYADAQLLLGRTKLLGKKWIEAEQSLRPALKLYEKLKPEAWGAFNAQSMLGGALLGQQKFADAQPMLVAGYEGMKKLGTSIPGNVKNRVIETIDRLIELNVAIDEPEEANKWRDERERFLESK